MATYDRATIEGMAMLAGWGKRSKDVSYVAMAESSGDASVVNSIGCVGLLQINQPVHVGSHPQWTVKWLKDPINNLKAGLVLYKAAGEKFDGPWLDSRDKGAGGGWGQHVKGSGTGGTGTDATQASDPCDALKGTPGYDYCVGKGRGDGDNSLIPGADVAGQVGRLAQAVAKAGEWIADPANWVRVIYVVGGGVLAIAAVNMVARPYISPAYQAIKQVIPTQTIRKAARQVSSTPREQ